MNHSGSGDASSLFSFDNESVTSNHTASTISDMTTPANRTKNNRSTESMSELEQISLQAMTYCSRFDDCSAPKCPLDILISMRHEAEGDPRCGMAKATRHKYWESMPGELKERLPFRRYLESEHNRMKAARERWESLSEEQRNEIKSRLTKGGPRA